MANISDTPWSKVFAIASAVINIIAVLYLVIKIIGFIINFNDFEKFIVQSIDYGKNMSLHSMAAIWLSVLVFLTIAAGISSILLPFGIYMESRALIEPWLLVWALIIALGFLEIFREVLTHGPIGGSTFKLTAICFMYWPVYLMYKTICQSDSAEDEPRR